MAPVSKSSKKSSALGIPSQHSQPSRKGKRAWRKHVNLAEVEQNLEDLRTEERITGSTLQKKSDSDLFLIDTTGDDGVRKSLPRFKASQLTSAKIIAQRSAVSAVFSRQSNSTHKKTGPRISYEEKARLLRIGKRKRLGPLNSIMDPSELGGGSAMLEPSRAVKESGKYDMWTESEEVIKGVNDTEEKRQFVAPFVKPPAPKHPQTPSLRAVIGIPAVATPHQGASYNPPLESHQELLRTAYDLANRKEKDAEKFAGVKEAADAARKVAQDIEEGVAPGMVVDTLEDNGSEITDGEDALVLPRLPTRKTKQQRLKAKKLRAERRALEEKANKKLVLTSVNAAKSFQSTFRRKSAESEKLKAKRRLALQERMKSAGLAGMRLGKHKVEDAPVDVQLGEELSESLRAMQPEGNLFRDRFLSLQHRALIEPRVRVLPKKHKAKTKDVEKFAWKRFE